MSKESDRCKRSVHRSCEEKGNYVKRLNRIEGQVRGISKMIGDDRHCDDILIQISAVNNAIKSLGQEILLNHMKTCMIDDINNKNYETIDEVMELCRRMMK
ncbi:MAG: metal-sensing transcriptional repressor [Bacilli bacterium]